MTAEYMVKNSESVMDRPFLPYGKQTITRTDHEAVARALDAPLLTTGPLVEEFEAAFAQRVGSREAIACSNGTAALHLAAMAIGLRKGDVVLAPSMSFVASANGPHYTGADIHFMDCDPDTGLVTVEAFADALDRYAGATIKAAVIVHLNGETADMAAISEIARSRNIILIEDACHAIGSRHAAGADDGAEVGSCRYSNMACFSLHPVKTITMGEGGVVTTNDPDLARRLRLFRSHGISREAADFSNGDLAFDAMGKANPWYYEMAEPGYNYRATDMACALGLSQLRQLDGFAARRRWLKQRYDRLFSDFDHRVRPVASVQSCDACRHLYPVLIDFDAIGATRAQFMKRLAVRGIGTQVHYIPIHRQPYYRSKMPDLTLKGADAYYQRVLSLPLFPLMTDDDPERVVESVAAAIAGDIQA
jgi:UDP-4-amino-4,6-dideoxy-N-acetyl-beta-L-altrosamine transaminase